MGVAIGALLWLAFELTSTLYYERGQADLKQQYEELESELREKHRVKLKAAHDARDEAIGKLQDANNDVDAEYVTKLESKNEQLQKDLDDLNNRNLRLYNDLQSERSDNRGSIDTTETSGQCDGAERVELSPAASRFLIREATRADRYTEQLSLCQKVLTNTLDAVAVYNAKLEKLREKAEGPDS